MTHELPESWGATTDQPGSAKVMNPGLAKVAERGSRGTGLIGENVGNQPAPENDWSYLNPNWEAWPVCKKGLRQSPIDLVRPYWGAFLKLDTDYQDQLWPVQVNDGRTIYVDFKEGDGSVLKIGAKELTPSRATFHVPSMHKLNGTSYDMEMQIIHKDTADNLVGLSVMMEVSDELPTDNFYFSNVMGHFFQNLPMAGQKRQAETFNLKAVLDEELTKHYITYHGSLTSPPCTEGVQWFVLGNAWKIPKDWVEGFKLAVTTPNVRPLQELGARVMESF